MALELEKLRPDTLLGSDLFLRQSDEGGYVLYKRKDMGVTQKDIERLIFNNVGALYVDAEDEDIVMDYLESNLNYLLESPELAPEKKSELLYDCATHRVKDVLSNPESSKNLKKSKDMVENAINYILAQEKALQSLMELMSHDYSIYAHSVNVCTLSVALAKFVGETSKTVLREIGLGALLHDVGKSKISEDILNKNGQLDEKEKALIMKHPLLGLEIIEKLIPAPGIIRLIVVQHHEKCDGSGYPYGLKGERIHKYSRLVCLVNMYDTLTTRGLYKNALKTFPALKLMIERMDRQLDPIFLNKFVQLLKK